MKGRMLYDTFIYPVNVGVNFPHPKFVIECPKSSTSTLLKHLKRYVLRSKVKIRDASEEYSLYSVWGDALVHGPGGEEKNVPTGSLVKGTKRISDIGCMDPRVPGFGYRAVLPQDKGNDNWWRLQHIPYPFSLIVKEKISKASYLLWVITQSSLKPSIQSAESCMEYRRVCTIYGQSNHFRWNPTLTTWTAVRKHPFHFFRNNPVFLLNCTLQSILGKDAT